jgi:hypothetical protein
LQATHDEYDEVTQVRVAMALDAFAHGKKATADEDLLASIERSARDV